MGDWKGLWICIDGADYTGKGEQTRRLASRLNELHEDNDVLLTHEPTRRAREIKRKLREEPDAYSDGLKLAELYVDDRIQHEREVILPLLNIGGIVISNRHKYSTDAYQHAQRVPYYKLHELQQKRGVHTPDLTLFLEIDSPTLIERMRSRNISADKFEGSREFQETVREKYRLLARLAPSDSSYFGIVHTLDGKGSKESVEGKIFEVVNPVYEQWATQWEHL